MASDSSHLDLNRLLSLTRDSRQMSRLARDAHLLRQLSRRLANAEERPRIVAVLANVMSNAHAAKHVEQNSDFARNLMRCLTASSSSASFLSRVIRCVANAANNSRPMATVFLDLDIFAALVDVLKRTQEQTRDESNKKLLHAVTRAIRVLDQSERSRDEVLQHKCLFHVARLLHQTRDDHQLLHCLLRATAHFTHGSYLVSECIEQLLSFDSNSTLQTAVQLINHDSKPISESALATVVNLSQVQHFRPSLGRVGAVAALVDKVNEGILSDKEETHTVTSLCLFCRESVNRMRLRESGGLALFVKLLNDKENSNRCRLQDRIINSLLQFAYDDFSLKVLQMYDLVPCLINFLQTFIDKNCNNVGIETSVDAKSGSSSDTTLTTADRKCTDSKSSDSADTSTTSIADAACTTPSTMATVTVNSGSTATSPSSSSATTVFSETTSTSSKSTASVPTTSGAQSSKPGTSSSSINYCNDVVSVGQETEIRNNQLTPSVDSKDEGGDEELDGNCDKQNEGSSKGSGESRQEQFRIHSPSYQEVQDEMAQYHRWCLQRQQQFGGQRALYSPDAASVSGWSESNGYSPQRDPGSCDGFSNDSPSWSHCSSPGRMSDNEETSLFMESYSPVEQYSDAEEEPESKRVKLVTMEKVEEEEEEDEALMTPRSCSSMSSLTPFKPMPIPGPRCASKEENKIGWILQILSRLSHMERPHESMLQKQTTMTLFNYLSRTKHPLDRAERILTRLSKSLHCVMAYVEERQMTWLRLQVDRHSSSWNSQLLERSKRMSTLYSELNTNVSLLAQTGYPEGQMCHVLMRGSDQEKRNVAISVPLLVRPRRQLRNILVSHLGLNVLLESLSSSLALESVLSLHVLSDHLGVVSPQLQFDADQTSTKREIKCLFNSAEEENDLTVLLDDGTEVSVNRSRLASGSSVLEAMLTSGAFVESKNDRINISRVNKAVFVPFAHYLYGCRWCPTLQSLDVHTLVELIRLSDLYLLTRFNRELSREVIERCLNVDEVVNVYELGLKDTYPMHGVSDNLSTSALYFILVGAMSHEKRAEIITELLGSELKETFIEDVEQTIEDRLLSEI